MIHTVPIAWHLVSCKTNAGRGYKGYSLQARQGLRAEHSSLEESMGDSFLSPAKCSGFLSEASPCSDALCS